MEKIEQTLMSMEVAEMVEKEHNKLLRDIRNYIKQLDESKIGHIDFFNASEYTDNLNRKNLVIWSRRKAANLSPIN